MNNIDFIKIKKISSLYRVKDSVPPHRHSEMEMHLIIQGNGFMKFGNELLSLSEDTFLISFPEDIHHIIINKRCRFISQYIVSCELSTGNEWFYSMLKDKFRAGVPNCGGQNIFPRIEHLWNSGDKILMSAAEHLLNAFILEKLRTGGTKFINPYIEKARYYMSRRVTEKFSLESVCRHIGLEKSYFCRLFKQLSGETPMQFFMRHKIELCKEMLAGGENNSGIAAATGFADEFHFSRTFKKLTGLSPRQYKDQL